MSSQFGRVFTHVVLGAVKAQWVILYYTGTCVVYIVYIVCVFNGLLSGSKCFSFQCRMHQLARLDAVQHLL